MFCSFDIVCFFLTLHHLNQIICIYIHVYMITVIFKYDKTQILHFLLLQKYPKMSLVITQGISQTRSDRVIVAFFISLLVTCCTKNYKDNEIEEMEKRIIILISCSTHICTSMWFWFFKQHLQMFCLVWYWLDKMLISYNLLICAF